MKAVFADLSNSKRYQVHRPLTLDSEQSNTKKNCCLPDTEQKC